LDDPSVAGISSNVKRMLASRIAFGFDVRASSD
jgi:hypothetical protein